MAHRSSRLRLLAFGALAVVGPLGIAACGSEGAEPAGEAEISDEAATLETTTTAAPTTEATPTTPTTPTTEPTPLGLFSPEESAQALYDAWKADDRATAATLAEPAAVEGQWATAPGDYAVYNQCDSGEFGTSGCLFRGSGGTIQYTMEQREDRWVVVSAFFSAP
jgi:hypothetical protein